MPAQTALSPSQPEPVSGEFRELSGRQFYTIRNAEQLPDFFVSLVSADNHWLFISTGGGLTAGRIDCEHALFPYETVDKIHDADNHSGPVTRILDLNAADRGVWAPFTRDISRRFVITRNVSKTLEGDCILFEEINHDLGLSFSYSWATGTEFGFVRQVSLRNLRDEPRSLRVLDGLRHLLAAGVRSELQTRYSCLVDAYKTSERIGDGLLAVYFLAAGISDQPSPMESLQATTVWSANDLSWELSLDPTTPDRFPGDRDGVSSARTVRGERGAYFLTGVRELRAKEEVNWEIVADVYRSQTEVTALMKKLDRPGIREMVRVDLDRNVRELRRKVGAADGLQTSGNRSSSAHHFTNVLFNIMRGGLFGDGYTIDRDDFRKYAASSNRAIAKRYDEEISALGSKIKKNDLEKWVSAKNDPTLLRLFLEYLPLSFSRRHGDPSRPWNYFSIRLRDAQGNPVLDYQGNWRDIFQNWEALALSFPDYLPHMIARFVNATSADGYNPYQVTRETVNWDRPNPADPWASIGYWGDHQIIYLLKLLEWTEAFHPGLLDSYLDKPLFVFADIPYRLAGYAATVKNPRQTITFDVEHDKAITRRCVDQGADGKFLQTPDSKLLRTGLAEKLLIPTLTKLGNFIPGGGIWMNTQRPEWNDANNALAGYGISVVTLAYLRRHVVFLESLFEHSAQESFSFDANVAVWLRETTEILSAVNAASQQEPQARRKIVDRLGLAAERYRNALYAQGRSGTFEKVDRATLIHFLKTARQAIDPALAANRRSDNLYHGYNLVHFTESGLEVKHLNEMLEGQVALLSSGLLDGAESLRLLDALQKSRLYWKEQRSYFLYPDRTLPGFLEKNRLPGDALKRSPLLAVLAESGNRRLIEHDAEGVLRFNPHVVNQSALDGVLAELRKEPRFTALVDSDTASVHALYEQVFSHHAFTGRSGSMFRYEGLGCIYWHMVAKLSLAVQETVLRARQAGESTDIVSALQRHYVEIRSGLGFQKTPSEYGAFPLDPYSHTPGDGHARQPGMTGLVKEEILTRLGELGVRIEHGQLRFDLQSLEKSELAPQAIEWRYFPLDGEERTLTVPKGGLAFTLAQVPVVYRPDLKPDELRLIDSRGKTIATMAQPELSVELTASLFSREGRIARVEVGIE
jgi:hypothetical protein